MKHSICRCLARRMRHSPPLGAVLFLIILHRPMRGKIKTLTISRSSTGKWYASFSVECEPERLPDNPSQVGTEVGLNTFASLSNGDEIANPSFFRNEEKALAKVPRKPSK